MPLDGNNLPSVVGGKKSESDFSTERDILYKVLFDMKSDLHDLKKLTLELLQNGSANVQEVNKNLIKKVFGQDENERTLIDENLRLKAANDNNSNSEQEEFDDDDENENQYFDAETIDEKEQLSLEAKEIELIIKSLDRNKNKRKAAADELGISERTLYRKIKQYDL